MIMMMQPQQPGSNPMLPMMLAMMGNLTKFRPTSIFDINLGGEAGGDILPLLMNMQKPPKIDPVTGALLPHEQGSRSKLKL